MGPVNARVPWSSVVRVVEHGERTQKNVAANIFLCFGVVVFFPAGVLDEKTSLV